MNVWKEILEDLLEAKENKYLELKKWLIIRFENMKQCTINDCLDCLEYEIYDIVKAVNDLKYCDLEISYFKEQIKNKKLEDGD